MRERFPTRAQKRVGAVGAYTQDNLREVLDRRSAKIPSTDLSGSEKGLVAGRSRGKRIRLRFLNRPGWHLRWRHRGRTLSVPCTDAERSVPLEREGRLRNSLIALMELANSSGVLASQHTAWYCMIGCTGGTRKRGTSCICRSGSTVPLPHPGP